MSEAHERPPGPPLDFDAVRRHFQHDRLGRLLGIEMVEISAGRAIARMPLREHHHNGLGIAHGGAVFTLADVAFAAASNSYGTVAMGVATSISFLKAVSTGTLTAEAAEVSRGNRLATYSIRVTDEQGVPVAVMQGTVYRKGCPLEPA